MKKNYLVTGGSGFLGYSLVKNLLLRSNKVFVFDNNFRGSFKKFSKKDKKKLFLIKGDIRKKRDLKKIIKKVDIVYHLAFINGTKYFYEKPKLVLDVGIQGTKNILELISKNKNIKAFYYASSSEVYNQPSKIPTDEKVKLIVPDPHNSRFSYGGAKLIGEIMTINYLRKTKIKYNIFRPHNLFGPNMGFEHVIPELIKKIITSSKNLREKKCIINIQGTGNETRAFCFIEDAIDQIKVIEKSSKNSEIYNVGQSREIKIKKLIKFISDHLNIKVSIKKKTLLSGSTLRRCPNMKKISKIGYTKKNNFLKGLRKTIDWYKDFYLTYEF